MNSDCRMSKPERGVLLAQRDQRDHRDLKSHFQTRGTHPTMWTASVAQAEAAGESRSTPRYMGLVSTYPLRPIRSDAQHEAALRVMRSLLGVERSEDENDYLHVLGDLIRAYELEHSSADSHPGGHPAVLARRSGDQEISQADLAAATGVAVSNISAILAGRRRDQQGKHDRLRQGFQGEVGSLSGWLMPEPR